MSNYISDNDDDLFDYDPQKDSSPTSNYSNFNTSSSDNDLLKKLKININNSDKEFNTNSAKLAIGFSSSTYHFIWSVYSESLVKSMIVSLDSLTNGDFSLLIRFHELEMKISKRMDFHLLVREIFIKNDSPSQSLEELFTFLNIEVSDLYISTCFLSSVAISNHALMLDRSEYVVLAKKLNIPTKHFLLESTLENESTVHKVFLSDFNTEVRQAINNAISQDVINQLKNNYQIDAKYNQS